MRLVVVDRFYTSVALAAQLLLMGFYCVGTIMTNRLGYCKQVIEKKKTRPEAIPRGSCKISRSKLVPDMKAISWWDSRPVHFLCTGGSTEMDRVVRQDCGEQVEVPCPRSLVLGLIDLAIVNGYIIHKDYHKNKESKPLTHVKYMIKLHLQLCQLHATDMYEGNTFGAPQPSTASRYEPLPVGDLEYGAALIAVNSVWTIALYSFYARFFLNTMPSAMGINGDSQGQEDLHISVSQVACNVGIYVGIPFA
ncbi:Hypothetical protein PHPALM_9429 [Phytophthora palmivora]|uniref:PiggyBac transposable element-derived protein domain-containing protein n=1 Tax=Phytophthora palmivora TaxID=4796 RepID=A0A2P4Y7C1_9STRA|nr:Hypothetical protein PHPALM_9429 [Phytophthora palmivora]